MLCKTAMVLAVLFACIGQVSGQTIKFSGYEWKVKSGEKLGPGPNRWSAANVRVDAEGLLHLKIAQREGVWECAELNTVRRLGLGAYQFQIVGKIDRLDKNVVLGLFNYPTPDVGEDGTNEIDIEFARWGDATFPIGNYTVWPATKTVKETTHPFRFSLTKDVTTQRFTWSSNSILFQSLLGRRDDSKDVYQTWLFQPATAAAIPQQPMPVFINLWLFRGQAPSDGAEVEIVIKSFKFTPLKPK